MHLPLGVGNINWLQKVRLLKNVGYDSTITIEVFGDDDDYLVMSKNKIKKLWDNTEAGEPIISRNGR
jgi:sugar phosphate isomerase/epimerase